MSDRRVTRADFESPDEMLIEVLGDPDKFGQAYFVAHWLDDNEWRGGSGVTGQVFVTNLDRFIEAQTRPVRILSDQTLEVAG